MSDDATPPPTTAAQAIGGVLRMVLFPVFLMLPAGTYRWWEAWAVAGVYLVWATTTWIWLARRDPALLAERLRSSPVQQDQVGWDRVVLGLLTVSGLGLLVVPGLDVVRFGWSEPLPLPLTLLALAVHVPAMLLLGWVMHTNTFLSRVVKIDEERGHHVITDGPYAWVRHPMYVGVLVMVMAFPVALGSRWGLVSAALMALALVVRTALEDRTLHETLPGYPEFAQTTRYRLFPGVW